MLSVTREGAGMEGPPQSLLHKSDSCYMTVDMVYQEEGWVAIVVYHSGRLQNTCSGWDRRPQGPVACVCQLSHNCTQNAKPIEVVTGKKQMQNQRGGGAGRRGANGKGVDLQNAYAGHSLTSSLSYDLTMGSMHSRDWSTQL